MKKIMFIVIILAAGLIVFPGLSNAESYISGYVGGAFPHDSDADSNVGPAVEEEMSFDNGVAVGLKGGHWFSEADASFFGLEIDFNAHFPSLDTLTATKGGSGTLTLDSDVSIYSVTGNILLRYPDGSIRPYIGGGGGWFSMEVDDGQIILAPLGASNLSFKGDSDSAFGWVALAGVDFMITPEVSLFAEYKYSGASFEIEEQVGLDIDYRASQVYGGVSFHFE